MPKAKIIKFKDWDCKIEKLKYPNGRIALELVAAKTDKKKEIYAGEPIETATTNFPEAFVDEDEAILRDDDDLLQALLDAKIVMETGNFYQGPYVRYPIVKVMI